MRRFTVSIALAIVAAMVAGCGATPANAPSFQTDGGKVRVATSFFPMYEFARAVGGDQIDLVNMMPTGAEPHDWEPTPAHIKVLNQADVFIYNGAGMEHWVEKTLDSLDNPDLIVVEASRGFDLVAGHEDHNHAGEEPAEHHGEDGHDHGGLDPHIWLDPLGAIHQVEAIRDALIEADPGNREAYQQNARRYIAQLEGLHQSYEEGLKVCRRDEFFTSHAAFGYLARRYHLEEHAIAGLAPEHEPRPQEMARIVKEAREHDVKYIFFETLVRDKVARTVAEEIGAETLVLNPLEGLTPEEIKAGKSYISVMKENLANLKVALECGK